ncbi:MAG: ATP-binding protein [bacterium]|nr:ATP-binding protein [bacterium]
MSPRSVFADEKKFSKLPVGIASFELIRTQGYLYVDKTPWIYHMATQGMYYFLSRPRRFGKSLLVSTLSNMFQGKKELFSGLWVAEQSDWDWQAHPVITLDFNEILHSTPDEMKQSLLLQLHRQADEAGVELHTDIPGMCFQELIHKLHNITGKSVVVLVDEYDKPMIDHLGRNEERLNIAKANRDILKSFFGVLKGISVASRLRFVFLTGISRFSKVSIFSELNNLDDISMNDRYAELLGYTQEELENCFHDEVIHLADTTGLSKAETLNNLARHYNGYRFSEAVTSVYNPFSILKCLQEQKFKPYWFETATPTFLINMLTRQHFRIPNIDRIQVSQSMFTTFELERLSSEALLFQTGYITIKDVQQQIYWLGYPNQEVKFALSESLFFAQAENIDKTASSRILQLSGYLRQHDLDAFFNAMTAIFASIPYDIQTKRDEAYYHTLFYLMISASGADAQSSVLTSKGRIDLVVIVPEQVYIIEFKCNQSAETALQQIRKKGYAEKYRHDNKALFLIGIDFSTESRNITEWTCMRE